MSYYEVLLFLHIAAAALWLGGAMLFFVLFQRAKAARDPVLAERLGSHVDWLAKRFFVPASIAVLVLGILLTIEGRWSFDQLWIILGLVGMAATSLWASASSSRPRRRCTRRSARTARDTRRSLATTAASKPSACSISSC